MTSILIDFETRSRVDLGDTSTYKYARHPSTEVLCMSYSIDGGPVQLWKPGEPFPFYEMVATVRAFNAGFELAIWNHCCVRKYGWPTLNPEQMECLQARSAYAGLPRKLASVCDAIGLGKQGKDIDGHKIMLTLCKPQRGKKNGCEFEGGKFCDDPEKHAVNEKYCSQDTVVEGVVDRVTPPLPEMERRLWVANQAINERGTPVDIDLCRNAVQMIAWEHERLGKEIVAATGGKISTPNQLAKIKDFLKAEGCPLPNMQENTLIDALADRLMPLTDNARTVLRARQLVRDAAASKYQATLNYADADGYCRDSHVYYKAGPGRFAGQGVQFQNLRRLNENEIDGYVALADRISGVSTPAEIYQELLATELGVIPTLGAMVRMIVRAHAGKKLVVSDYTAIEMRVLHWMAGDQRTLQAIYDFDKGIGEEPYKLAAATIYGKKVEDVTKAERQIGKVMILGCGYLQGAEKFGVFCGNYGIDMPLDKSQEIVQLYRRSYPAVKQFWYATGKAATTAVTKRVKTSSGPVEFYMTGHTLNARLPSGREVKYYNATVEEGMYGPEIAALDQRSGGYRVVGLPVLIENLDQAISRDLLADALLKCHANNAPVVLHVHDEIVVEVTATNDKAATMLQQIMEDKPAWAKGLPIAAKTGESVRYTK